MNNSEEKVVLIAVHWKGAVHFVTEQEWKDLTDGWLNIRDMFE